MISMYSVLWRPSFLWVKKLNITMDSSVPQLLEARVPRGRSKSVRLHLDF